MAKKKVTDQDILNVFVDNTIKTQKERAEALGISTVTLWDRTNKIENFNQLVLDIIKEATVVIASDGFKEMARIINSPCSQDKDKIQAFKTVLQHRGELVDKREIDIPEGINITISEKKK